MSRVIPSVQQRVDVFRRLLEDTDTRENDIRLLCVQGIPDVDGLRARCWKILLGYTPPGSGEAQAKLSRSRELYYEYVDTTVQGQPQNESAQTSDHPLSEAPTSQWQGFFKDNELLKQIDKDVRRTLPTIGLMKTAVGSANNHIRARPHIPFLLVQRMFGEGQQNRSRVRIDFPLTGTAEEELHWQVIQRILYVFCKLSPGIGYVQGINDIVAPIYYVFVKDSDETNRLYAEADAFHCLWLLMVDMSPLYVKGIDNTVDGIQSVLAGVNKRLKEYDLPLWFHLDNQELHPQFYGFRWLTLLFSQEFALPDVLRLWDSLLSMERRIDFVVNVCCAMLLCVRDDLLKQDFAENVLLLQSYPITDVSIILDETAKVFGFE